MQVGTHWSRQVHLFMIFHHRVGFQSPRLVGLPSFDRIVNYVEHTVFYYLELLRKNWCWKRLINPKVKNTV